MYIHHKNTQNEITHDDEVLISAVIGFILKYE